MFEYVICLFSRFYYYYYWTISSNCNWLFDKNLRIDYQLTRLLGELLLCIYFFVHIFLFYLIFGRGDSVLAYFVKLFSFAYDFRRFALTNIFFFVSKFSCSNYICVWVCYHYTPYAASVHCAQIQNDQLSIVCFQSAGSNLILLVVSHVHISEPSHGQCVFILFAPPPPHPNDLYYYFPEIFLS